MKPGASKSSLRLANSSQTETGEKKRRNIPLSRLINLLNRINFQDGDIILHFRHRKYKHTITVLAKPQICNDDFLRCHWSDHFDADNKLRHFRFQHFTFTDGLSQILVPAKDREINSNGVYLELPDFSHEIKTREIRRHACQGISAQILQDGKVAEAELSTFSAQAFALKLDSDPARASLTFDPTSPVNVIFRDGSDIIFSGNCECIRHTMPSNGQQLILQPLKNNIRLFKPKEIRSERLVLNPLPNILFRHPLTGKKGNLKLIDISGTGFAVAEDEENAVLMPGMIIPKLKVEFIHGFSVQCRAQVIYRLPTETHIKCGVAILDMKMEDHIKLSSYLHQAKNKHSYVSSSNVDLEALWDFFFASGFIYPDKYLHLMEQKDLFQQLYLKLYNECPEISRHVIYQDKGIIYGHVAMFRYYRKTWLMHHHAAIKSSKHKAGLVVMEHILQYINECHTLPSARMKYIACYFRPNNRFANRVFGGAARSLDDPLKCSLDNFAYFHLGPETSRKPLPPGWTFDRTLPDDLQILQHWYTTLAGGLLIQGLDLEPEAEEMDRITCREYGEVGFFRSRDLLSLKNDGELIALFAVNHSDVCMNMSDLTNCIQAFVLDGEQLTKTILHDVFTELLDHFAREDVPVLLYPDTYAAQAGIPYDKTYALTVLDLDNISPYLMFMHSLTTQKERKVKHPS